MDREVKEHELEELRQRVQTLEAELGEQTYPPEVPIEWPPRHFYTTYAVTAGFVLGLFGATTSLLFNIVGSLLVQQPPLRLIQIYLRIPLGDRADQLAESGIILAVGVCLYLFTGMVLGIPFQLVLCRWFEKASFATRFVVASGLALALWLINFYGLISWIQPLFFGGPPIINDIPWWVAALTHLVFGWTMLLVQPLGLFVAPVRAEKA